MCVQVLTTTHVQIQFGCKSKLMQTTNIQAHKHVTSSISTQGCNKPTNEFLSARGKMQPAGTRALTALVRDWQPRLPSGKGRCRRCTLASTFATTLLLLRVWLFM